MSDGDEVVDSGGGGVAKTYLRRSPRMKGLSRESDRKATHLLGIVRKAGEAGAGIDARYTE